MLIDYLMQGLHCWDSDFIYTMYHLKGAEPETPGHEQVWADAAEKSIDLLVTKRVANYFDYVFTADPRVRDALKEIGFKVRTLEKRFIKDADVVSQERDLLPSDGGDRK
jgi:hypothetical protein